MTSSTIQTTATTVEIKALRAALDWVGKATNSRRSAPDIYSHVLMRNGDGRLRLTATNGEYWAEASVASDSQDAWEVALPVKKLKAILVGIKEKTISIAYDGSHYIPYVLVVAGYEERRIDGESAEKFPTNPIYKGGNEYIKRMDCTAWHAVVPAAATENSRPVLTGVLLDGENMVAADGFRLAVAPGPVVDGLRVLIPITIGKFLPTTGTVGLYLHATKTYATLELNGSRWVSVQLIQGNYPNYPPLMPTEWDAQVITSRQALLNACNRLAPLTKSGIVRLIYDDGALTVSVAPEGGVVTGERIPATRNGSEGFQIAFNIRHLQELLPTLTTPDVMIEITSPSAPATFTGAASDPRWVVMPMFVQW